MEPGSVPCSRGDDIKQQLTPHLHPPAAAQRQLWWWTQKWMLRDLSPAVGMAPPPPGGSTSSTHLVLPLELGPHLPELCVCAAGRLDVIHDVDVDIAEHHTVPVTGSAGYVVHCGGHKDRLTPLNVPHNAMLRYGVPLNEALPPNTFPNTQQSMCEDNSRAQTDRCSRR